MCPAPLAWISDSDRHELNFDIFLDMLKSSELKRDQPNPSSSTICHLPILAHLLPPHSADFNALSPAFNPAGINYHHHATSPDDITIQPIFSMSHPPPPVSCLVLSPSF